MSLADAITLVIVIITVITIITMIMVIMVTDLWQRRQLPGARFLKAINNEKAFLF
ncbi:unnamed protein product [Tetraodon nigroviridis]|uniref:(spotted green pufferfish) hypothetical protein n=1 Tax=Tetraodon nigroviridis TaxID=99883 RepID=Q4RMS7_TETNG|nr:unnamed protein product [Tetraodon nigroviridis]